MLRKVSTRYLVLGLALYAALLFSVHTFITDDLHIVWSSAGIAAFGVAAAALTTAFVKVKEYMDKTDELEEKVNGGLADAARTHLQDNEVFETLIHRQDRLEDRLDAETGAKEACEEALTELRLWVVERLDATGNGRTNGRTNET